MSAILIKRLIEERNKTWEEAKAVVDSVETEERDFASDEEEKFTKANERIDELDKRISALHESEERNKRAEEIRSKYDDVIRPSDPSRREEEERSDGGFEDEVRSFLKGETRGIDVRPEARTLSKLSAVAGGNTVKTSFYARLVEHLVEVSGVLAAGPTMINTDTGETIQIPKTTAFSSAALTAEAATIAASDPAFGQVSLGAYKYAVLMQLSNELVNDTTLDLLGLLARQAGRAVGNQAGVDFAVGNGSSKPTGIIQGATVGVTGGASVAGAFTADNLIDLYYSVIEPYRRSPNCAWLMRDATMAGVRKLKDTTGQYLWQPSIQVGAPDTILGKPVHTDPNIAAVALSAKSVAFGDFSTYFIRQVNGVRFERSDDFAFSSDLVTFRCIYRADGNLIDTSGSMKVFQGNSA